MTRSKITRWVKGAAVSAAAVTACYWIWTSLREWAQDVDAADPGTFAGFPERLLATITGVVSMPVLLWAGMRMLGERGNHLLVLVGAMLWPFVGGHVVEEDVSTLGAAVFLAMFAVLTSLLAPVKVSEKASG